MKEVISRELLSEVLNKKVTIIEIISANLLQYTYVNEYSDNGYSFNVINIYELAHKCKEWAYSKKLLIRSSCDGFITVSENINDYNRVDFKFTSDTEHEAIFKACQWILDTIKEVTK